MNCYPGGIPYRLQVVDNPWHLGFSRETEAGEMGAGLAKTILNSLYEFMGDFCKPLSMDLSLWYWDEETDMPMDLEESSGSPELLGRLLRAKSPYISDFGGLWNDQVVSDASADVIDRQRALDFYEDAVESIAQRVPRMSISWNEIQIRAAYLKLPEISDQLTLGYDHVRALDHRGTAFPQPIEWIEGAAWLPGPVLGQINAPVEIRAYRYFGEMVIDVDIYNYAWNPDTPDSSGYADILKGITALERRGWVRQ